jgi:hypothetical protein
MLQKQAGWISDLEEWSLRDVAVERLMVVSEWDFRGVSPVNTVYNIV